MPRHERTVGVRRTLPFFSGCSAQNELAAYCAGIQQACPCTGTGPGTSTEYDGQVTSTLVPSTSMFTLPVSLGRMGSGVSLVMRCYGFRIADWVQHLEVLYVGVESDSHCPDLLGALVGA